MCKQLVDLKKADDFREGKNLVVMANQLSREENWRWKKHDDIYMR